MRLSHACHVVETDIIIIEHTIIGNIFVIEHVIIIIMEHVAINAIRERVIIIMRFLPIRVFINLKFGRVIPDAACRRR